MLKEEPHWQTALNDRIEVIAAMAKKGKKIETSDIVSYESACKLVEILQRQDLKLLMTIVRRSLPPLANGGETQATRLPLYAHACDGVETAINVVHSETDIVDSIPGSKKLLEIRVRAIDNKGDTLVTPHLVDRDLHYLLGYDQQSSAYLLAAPSASLAIGFGLTPLANIPSTNLGPNNPDVKISNILHQNFDRFPGLTPEGIDATLLKELRLLDARLFGSAMLGLAAETPGQPEPSVKIISTEALN